MKATPESPNNSGCRRRRPSAPIGLARFHENALRDSFGNDSGRTKRP